MVCITALLCFIPVSDLVPPPLRCARKQRDGRVEFAEDHEAGNTYQSQSLGAFYVPVVAMSAVLGSNSFIERQADDFGKARFKCSGAH